MRVETLDLLLQIVDGHVLELDLLSAINIRGICDNTDGHAGTWDVREPMKIRSGMI